MTLHNLIVFIAIYHICQCIMSATFLYHTSVINLGFQTAVLVWAIYHTQPYHYR